MRKNRISWASTCYLGENCHFCKIRIYVSYHSEKERMPSLFDKSEAMSLYLTPEMHSFRSLVCALLESDQEGFQDWDKHFSSWVSIEEMDSGWSAAPRHFITEAFLRTLPVIKQIHRIRWPKYALIYLFINWDNVVKKLCKLSFVNSISSFRKAGNFEINLESRWWSNAGL